MKRINTILKNIHLPSSWEGVGVGFLPSLREGLGVGLLLLLLLLLMASCTGKPSSLADVAEEDSLFIDTVATLDEELAPDTLVLDSLALDSL